MSTDDDDRPGLIRRFLEALLGHVPVAPERHRNDGDGLFDGFDALPPDESDAQMRTWHGRNRRGAATAGAEASRALPSGLGGRPGA